MSGLHRLIDLLDEALCGLSARYDARQLEDLSTLVSNIMSWQSRQFHTLEHVFGFWKGSDPISLLAAVFHDLIYYQVDEGFPGELGALFGPYLKSDRGSLYLNDPSGGEDPAFITTSRIFAMDHGQRVTTSTGLNEFLSALIMNRLLSSVVREIDVIAITVCIEASIPFRGLDERGLSSHDRLEQRLIETQKDFLWPIDRGDIETMIHRAVAFSNRDVSDFGLADPSRFLSNTWKLLPELNAPLRVKAVYTISDYRRALQKMEAFFQFLKPDNVFHAWRGIPSPHEIQLLTARASANLATGIEYLQAKQLSIGILEALALVSGGDAPLSLFTGERDSASQEGKKIEDYLPKTSQSLLFKAGSVVAGLLQDGRHEESVFDLRDSPLAAFLYHRLKKETFVERMASAKEFFSGKMTPQDFLRGWKSDLLGPIANACASMVRTRREDLLLWS